MSLDLTGLREHQKPGAEVLHRALLTHKSALDASDLGAGKTHVATVLFRNYNLPTLVVCPLSVMPGWERAAALQGAEFDVLNYDKLRTGKTPYGAWEDRGKRNGKPVYRFRWADEIGALAFDEVHRCKAPDSDQSKMLIAARRQGIPTLMLSGTPATGPHEMRALGYHLGLHQGVDWWRWAQRNGCIVPPFGGLRFVDSAKLSRAERMKLLFDKLISEGRMVRLKVPRDNTIVPELYNLAEGEELDDLYTEMHSAIEALNKVAASDKDPDLAITHLLRARQRIELVKVPILLDRIADDVAQGASVVVFCDFSQTIEELDKRLRPGIFASRIEGDQSPAERESNRQRFQENKTPVCLANYGAGDVGIDLHDTVGGHPRRTYHLPGYSAIKFRQATGRTARDGMLSAAWQAVVLINSSKYERELHRSLSAKLNNLDALIDGDLTLGNLRLSGVAQKKWEKRVDSAAESNR